MFALTLLSATAVGQQLQNTTWVADIVGIPGLTYSYFGTDTVVTSNIMATVESLFMINGDTIQYQDITASSPCAGSQIGYYRFTFSANSDSMYFEVIEDQCSDRRAVLNLSAWSRVNTGMLDPSGDERLLVYPSPCSGELTVDAYHAGAIACDLWNISGQLVQEASTKERSQFTLDVSDLPNGLYFVRVETEQGMVTRKVIVQH